MNTDLSENASNCITKADRVSDNEHLQKQSYTDNQHLVFLARYLKVMIQIKFFRKSAPLRATFLKQTTSNK